MIAGHLQEKGEQFYAVLSYKDKNGKRHTKWIPTGLQVRGNKKRAEKALSEILGHSSVNVTMNYYVHPSMESKRRRVAHFSKRVFSDRKR